MMMHGKAKQSEPHGPGGMKPVLSRNPNDHDYVNDSPDGPYAHGLGLTGDGGMHGKDKVSGKGNTFWIR